MQIILKPKAHPEDPEDVSVLVPCPYCDGADPGCVCVEYEPHIAGTQADTLWFLPRIEIPWSNFKVLADALGTPATPQGVLPARALPLVVAQLESYIARPGLLSAQAEALASEAHGAEIVCFPPENEGWAFSLQPYKDLVEYSYRHGRDLAWCPAC